MSSPKKAHFPPIAIVGASAIFPGSTDAHGFWRDILAGRDLITDVPEHRWLLQDHYDPDPKAEDKTYCRRGSFLGEIDFDPIEFGVQPTAIAATDTCQLLALIAARQVLDDAMKNQFTELNRERASVILGVTSGQQLFLNVTCRLQRGVWMKALRESGVVEEEAKQICDRITNSYVPWQENTFPGLLGNVVAGRIANRFNLGGTNCVIDAACASSLSALAMAVDELHLGHSDLVITGGADTFNDAPMFVAFSKTPALSKSGDCRPFSDKADGTILGEGVSLFALRRLEDAERDGNRIYAVIRGLGSSSDGRSKSIYAPVPEGQAKALRRCYESAGYGPETVGMVEAHGTGTVAGDAAEFEGLRQVFSEASEEKQWCALGSVKSQIGHTKAAAGAASLFKATMSLHHRILPPTIKVDQPNPKINIGSSPFYLNTKTRPWVRPADYPRRASISSFGFGGTNFHVAMEEYDGPGVRPPQHWNAASELFTVSGSSQADLDSRCKALAGKVTDHNFPLQARESQVSFDAAAPFRMAAVAENVADLRKKLDPANRAMPGVYSGSTKPTGTTAFLFPGQGSQYVGMTSDISMAFQEARAAWDGAPWLGEAVFPQPVYSDADRNAQAATLRQTEWAQPAIGTASVAILNILTTLGVSPDCVGGHSFGEITALYASGGTDLDTMVGIARKRGELMALASSVPGAMLSVRDGADQTQAMLTEWGVDVSVANRNSPTQTVLSGTVTAIAEAELRFKERGNTVVRLPVSTAFHSPLVAPAAGAFRAHLEDCYLSEATLPFYANFDGDLHPTAPSLMRDRLADQVASSVRFHEMVEKMYEDGVRTFVEVGPSAVLSSLVKSILGDRPFTAISLDRQGTNGVTALWHGLGQLAVQGVPMNWADLRKQHDILPEPGPAPKFVVKINGGNYGRPYPPAGGAAALPKPVVKAVVVAPVAAAPVVVAKAVEAPKPTPPPPVAAAPAPAPAPVAPPTPKPIAPQMSAPTTTPNNATDLYRVFQESISQAHFGWQSSLAKAHEDYLKTIEGAYLAALGTPVARTAGVAPAPITPAPAVGQAFLPAAAFQAAVTVPPTAPAPPPPVAAAVPAPVSKAPVAAPPAPQAPNPAPVAAAKAAVNYTTVLLDVIADKTGYPVDMLNPDMALEADLGIDSIKRVEIFAAMIEKVPGMKEPDMAELGPLRTIADIANYLGASSPAPVAATVAAPSKLAAPTVNYTAVLLDVIADKTGYPVDMLNPDMALEADLGIDSIKRVEIFAAMIEKVPGMKEPDMAELGPLRTIADIANYLGASSPAPVAATPAPAPAKPAAPSVNYTAVLIDVIADKTGYPVDMLNPDMALEADLGIDSIKRVEIFAAMIEKVPGMKEPDMAELGPLRTIADIANYLGAGSPAPAAASTPVVAIPAARSVNYTAVLIDVIADKTGYPVDMLNPDMALEADLGIDSIKRVEIFAAMIEKVPGMKEPDMAELGPLRTIADIANYLGAGSPAPAVAPVAAAPTAPSVNYTAVLIDVIADKTGYPVDMLNPDMALEADLGIDSIKRVEIFAAMIEKVPGMNEPDMAELGPLRTIADIANYLGAGSPAPTPTPSAATAPQPAPTGLRQVLHTRPAAATGHSILDESIGSVTITDDGMGIADALSELLIVRGFEAAVVDEIPGGMRAVICLSGIRPFENREQAVAANEQAYRTAHAIAPVLSAEGGVFVTVQDTGGSFAPKDDRAWAGGLSALAKTAAIEWPKAKVKAIDIDLAGRTPHTIAQALLNELLNGGKELEVGLGARNERVAVETTFGPASGSDLGLAKDAVIVASGGARGVTAQSLIHLARRAGGRYVLLGRTPIADEPAFCAGKTTESELKQAFIADAKSRGESASPAAVGKKVSQVIASREVREVLAGFQTAGAEARYVALDIRKAAEVSQALDQVRKDWGPVAGIVHGAGVLADKLLTELTPDKFEAVFSTKVEGLEALLDATASDKLKFLCMFSSVAARTGNTGQAAYAMANEVLNRVAQSKAGKGTRVKSLNWGPWDGGMVTPGLRKHFAQNGIKLLGIEEGAELFVDEILSGADSEVEIVLGHPLV